MTLLPSRSISRMDLGGSATAQEQSWQDVWRMEQHRVGLVIREQPDQRIVDRLQLLARRGRGGPRSPRSGRIPSRRWRPPSATGWPGPSAACARARTAAATIRPGDRRAGCGRRPVSADRSPASARQERCRRRSTPSRAGSCQPAWRICARSCMRNSTLDGSERAGLRARSRQVRRLYSERSGRPKRRRKAGRRLTRRSDQAGARALTKG